ncbi:MAG: molybdopterin-dependent oxidoreductase [Thermomicrobiales bacterium]|nr:molybdopterin-dependent oxidoreductase [Thermomicrobiales bacterium]
MGERSIDTTNSEHRVIPAGLAGRAGALSAAIMLAVQLIWRLNWSKNGVVQAFPELIAAAIARLTPLSVFGAATENYGSLAKRTLFVCVLIGVIAVGRWAGRTAGQISNAIGPGWKSRFGSALVVTAFLWLATNLLVLPIAYLGPFARTSSYTGEIFWQLLLTFLLFALVWSLLTAPDPEEDPMPNYGETLSRRSMIRRSTTSALPIATAIALGGSTWRLLAPKTASTATPLIVTGTSTSGTATVEAITVKEIIATQRANQGYDLNASPEVEPEPTPTSDKSSSRPEPRKSAQLDSDSAPDSTPENPFELYDGLEEEGRLTPLLTETADFYHVSKNFSDPRVSAEGWSLMITGMVNSPLLFTHDQLVERATTRKITTLGCISNELNGDLIGTAEWIGVPLADLLTEAGVQEGVFDLVLHAADDYEDSIPIANALDPDTMVVIGMNGTLLPDDHGFPARLIVPGIFGMKNVKWLDRIELVDHDFMGYWQTRGWADDAPYQSWGRIDYPTGRIAPGPTWASGVASAGDRDVVRVEVSIDGGESWSDAQIEPSINPPLTWVRWAHQFEAVDGADFNLVMRVTDGNGTLMDETLRSPLPVGATGWPRRYITVRA